MEEGIKLIMNRPEGNLRCSAYSPCGRYFAWASPEWYVCPLPIYVSLRVQNHAVSHLTSY
jgi:hypothetical protein